MALTIRFNDFSETGGSHRFAHAQFRNSVINTTLEGIFRDVMSGAGRPVPHDERITRVCATTVVENTCWSPCSIWAMA